MTPIKRHCQFLVDKEKGKEDGRLRYRIKWNGEILAFNAGYRVQLSKWSKETQRCKANTTHGRDKVSAYEINRVIQTMEDDIASIFYKYERENLIPTKENIKEDYNILIGNIKDKDNIEIEFLFNRFIDEENVIHAWSKPYKEKMKVIKKHLVSIKKDSSIQDINEDFLQKFINYMFNSLKLRTTTASKYFKHVITFLNWCNKKDYLDKKQYKNFTPTFKGLNSKEVIYLEWEELMTLYNYDFSQDTTFDKVRDVFCFCCFTGLRYSDVAKLTKEDIYDDCIEVVTNKTIDRLIIELNKYSRALLNKYKNNKTKKAFPIISNQKMNLYLKQICKNMEFDEKIKVTYFIGLKRKEEVFKKYELIGTHCARRTFVVNALTLGIPPHVIMKWTGHSDMQSMKPYTKIVDQLKKDEMDKFNR